MRDNSAKTLGKMAPVHRVETATLGLSRRFIAAYQSETGPTPEEVDRFRDACLREALRTVPCSLTVQ